MKSGSLFLSVATFVLASLLFAVPQQAEAKAKAGYYVDTKKRFSLQMPHGWSLAPMPGDLSGMLFRRVIRDTPALFHVSVAKVRDKDSLKSAMQRLTKDFAGEIGYRKLGDLPVELDGLSAMRRTHSVMLNGDQHLLRYAVDTVLIAYGYVHLLHFETTEKSFALFRDDLQAFLARYHALAGRSLYQRLVGDWRAVANPDLQFKLGADLLYQLGSHHGYFRANGKRLTLISPEGRESFRYQLSEDNLVLHNKNLGSPLVYRRSAAMTASLTALTGPARDDDGLVGRWRVLDSDLQLILSPSGAVKFGPLSGRYKIKDHLLSITSASGVEVTYHFALRSGRLSLSGGDLDKTLVLQRIPR